MWRWYARILSRYPYVVILVVLVVVTVCLVVNITLGNSLEFSKPQAGFETRGTEIADRYLTFKNLIDNVGGKTNVLPKGTNVKSIGTSRVKKKSEENQSSDTKRRSISLTNTVSKLERREKRNTNSNETKNMFCGVPDDSFSRIVIESSRGRNLFNLEDIQAICQLETQYFLGLKVYQDQCEKNEADGSCCTAWSLGSYIAVLRDKVSCENITEEDVSTIKRRMSECAPFLHNNSLKMDCDWFSECHSIPYPCGQYNAIFNMFHYLSDSEFMSYTSTELQAGSPVLKDHLRYSSIFLPVRTMNNPTDIFQYLDSLPRNFKNIIVVAAEFGVKYSMFEKYLISDAVWLAAVCVAIFLAMWLYTTSVFITIMAFLSMFWAVNVAYFLYTFVFKISFFPYINMVAIVVIVGIGADDLFIYCRAWRLAKSEKNNGVLEKLVVNTLHHTVLSMLVTSLTTAAAFYANYISDIIAVRCFSVFAGTCMVINFIMTVTWIPASIMVQEKWLRCCVDLNNKQCNFLYCLCKIPYQLYYLICDWSRIYFEKILPCLVIKFRYIWLIIFSILWIGSVVVIFFYPRLKLPSSKKFQMFSSNHLLERYDLQIGEFFPFEVIKQDKEREFSINVVWGVLPKNNGDPLNPDNKGSLIFDPEFDLTTPEAQRWMLQFCYHLRHTDFYLKTSDFSYTDCFLENFRKFMSQDCSSLDDTECCNKTGFPVPSTRLVTCLATYIELLKNTPGVNYNKNSPGPRFSDGKISAFFVRFRSNHTFSLSFEDAQDFYTKVNQWVSNQMLSAPPEMKRGWFISSELNPTSSELNPTSNELSFYDLQSSLAMGTPLALGVSLSVVAIVTFFTTLNVLISLYAFLAVAATICVTLASLVLMSWELNILESVIITIAIGLAIDITLHYGVAYRLAPDVGKEIRVITSLSHMGSPVAMATLTTMLAGAFIMPSTVLVYKKFGIFLILLVSLAWLYATFFFQSLLRIMGPNGGCGQFHWPASDCCVPVPRDHKDKTVYALSESTSSTSTREHSHAHNSSSQRELEPLTDQDHQSHSPHQYNPHPVTVIVFV